MSNWVLFIRHFCTHATAIVYRLSTIVYRHENVTKDKDYLNFAALYFHYQIDLVQHVHVWSSVVALRSINFHPFRCRFPPELFNVGEKVKTSR